MSVQPPNKKLAKAREPTRLERVAEPLPVAHEKRTLVVHHFEWHRIVYAALAGGAFFIIAVATVV